jgi:DNA-binding NarL/FixJ family response regulator
MGIRILLADDHRITREGVRLMLDQQPEFAVIGETGDGRQAVELAAELRPDVVIMDLTMPSLNGVEATRQVKAQNPDVKVIVLSMHLERQFISETLAAGASGYLLKDSPSEELLKAIRTVAAGDPYLSPRVQEVLVANCLTAASTERGLQSLSPREREVLQMTAEGKNTKEIALLLHLSSKTVEGHRRQLMSKLNINSIADLTRYAIREGIASLS